MISKRNPGNAKLTDEMVMAIKMWLRQGRTYRTICELVKQQFEVSVSRATIGRINREITYKGTRASA